jgi:hypothetical protein
MKLCRLQYLVGRVEDCPEERCPFWESEHGFVEGGCAFEKLDVADHPALASWLLRIRKQLEDAQGGARDGEAHRLFYRLLDERS